MIEWLLVIAFFTEQGAGTSRVIGIRTYDDKAKCERAVEAIEGGREAVIAICKEMRVFDRLPGTPPQ